MTKTDRNKLNRLVRAMGLRVRALRTEAKMSQADLASKVGVTSGQISHIEGGRKFPSLTLLAILAAELRSTTDHLLTGK